MADQSNETAFERGHVVWHDGLFTDEGRPWLVLSDARHPFHGHEYLVAGITTTERGPAVPLSDDAWVVGGLPRASFASPWFVSTLKHARIVRGVGALSGRVVNHVAAEAAGYLGVA